MNACKNCGEKLKQDGSCPACAARLEKNQRKQKSLLIIGISIVVIIVCAFLVGWLAKSSEAKKEQTSAQQQMVPTFVAEDYDLTGTCGKNMQWGFVEATGELVIIGDGKMDDYEVKKGSMGSTYSSAPWGQYDVKSVKLSGLTTIGDYAFYCCSGLNAVEFGDHVKTIGKEAFLGCESLTLVEIPNGVKTIEEGAFAWCQNLKEVQISQSVTVIELGAFYYCHSLMQFQVDEDNPSYMDKDGVLLTKDQKTLLQYPGGKTQESYTIPVGVTSIEMYAFSECNYLTEVQIPETVTSIGHGAFEFCRGLSAIEIPDSVTMIGESVFSGSAVREIKVDITNPAYRVVDNVLFTKDQKTLVLYIGTGEDRYVIPESVEMLEDGAFEHVGPRAVEMPTSVKIIGDGVFYSSTEIYYQGTKEQWNAIEIGGYNWQPDGATIYYNSNSEAEPQVVDG